MAFHDDTFAFVQNRFQKWFHSGASIVLDNYYSLHLELLATTLLLKSYIMVCVHGTVRVHVQNNIYHCTMYKSHVCNDKICLKVFGGPETESFVWWFVWLVVKWIISLKCWWTGRCSLLGSPSLPSALQSSRTRQCRRTICTASRDCVKYQPALHLG